MIDPQAVELPPVGKRGPRGQLDRVRSGWGRAPMVWVGLRLLSPGEKTTVSCVRAQGVLSRPLLSSTFYT